MPNVDFRCGTIAIVGRPNVGKSTIMNALVGQKISITSRKIQTTRHSITGIKTCNDVQYIFIDTPGFQKKYNNRLNQISNKTIISVLTSDINLIFWVLESCIITNDDKEIIKLLPNTTNIIAIVNKIDCLKDKTILSTFFQEISQLKKITDIIAISAKNKNDIQNLLLILKKYLPVKKAIHYENKITNCSEEFLASEIIREKIFRFTGKELPYTSSVLIEEFTFNAQKNIRKIFATILVSHKNHKPMLIGVNGNKIKQISLNARSDMINLFNSSIYLKIFVKFHKKQNSEDVFNSSIYFKDI